MIKLACKIPKQVVLACSGGRDSMSALEFLVKGNRDVTVAYFNHGTDHADEAEVFLEKFCDRQKLSLVVGRYKHKNTDKNPTEASWRSARYEFLSGLNLPIITGHHLGDAVEWWIFSSLRGNPNLTPVKRQDIEVLRPFLLTTPTDLHAHASKYPHIQDESNFTDNYARNVIRNNILEHALKVNPGLYTTVRNLYEK